MKTLIRNLTGIVIGLPLLAGASNTPHFILFDQPFVMSKKAVRVDVERVEEKFVESSNGWVVGKVKRSNVACDLDIKILGRDFATQNKIIGEHYTGEIEFSCDVDAQKLNFEFTRTIFLGIRNCVKSETFTDSDSCDIYAVALGEERSLLKDGGPMIRESDRQRIYYRITSNSAGTNIGSSNLIPQGVRPTTINAYQMIKLSMERKGTEIFIEKPNSHSNVQKGNNIYLSLSPQSVERDNNLRKSVEGSSEELAKILMEIQSSSNPQEAIVQNTASFLATLSKATKELLAIVSPVHFIQLESALSRHEKAFSELWTKLQPNTKLDDSLKSRHGDLFEAYQNMKTYSNERSTKDDAANSALQSAYYSGGGGNSGATGAPVVGKEFFENNRDLETAYRAGYNRCIEYLGSFPVTVRSTLTCREKKRWSNSNEYFIIWYLDSL